MSNKYNDLKDELNRMENHGRKKKEKIRSPLREESKKIKKQKHRRAPMIFFATTFVLMLAYCLTMCLSYVFAPTFTLEATISVVPGGYQLNYTICNDNVVSSTGINVGDKIYVDDIGRRTYTSRNSMLMKVEEINDSHTVLSFTTNNIPTFISTEDFCNIITSEKAPNSVSRVYVVGKSILNKFTMTSIRLSRND